MLKSKNAAIKEIIAPYVNAIDGDKIVHMVPTKKLDIKSPIPSTLFRIP